MAGNQVRREQLTAQQWCDFSRMMELQVRLKRRIEERRAALAKGGGRGES